MEDLGRVHKRRRLLCSLKNDKKCYRSSTGRTGKLTSVCPLRWPIKVCPPRRKVPRGKTEQLPLVKLLETGSDDDHFLCETRSLTAESNVSSSLHPTKSAYWKPAKVERFCDLLLISQICIIPRRTRRKRENRFAVSHKKGKHLWLAVSERGGGALCNYASAIHILLLLPVEKPAKVCRICQ